MFEQYRHQLEELQKELELRVTKARISLSKEHSADWSEQAIERENDEVLVELVREGEQELAQIKMSLARMESGDYGQCSNCKDKINPARLCAMPMSTLCIHCAEKL